MSILKTKRTVEITETSVLGLLRAAGYQIGAEADVKIHSPQHGHRYGGSGRYGDGPIISVTWTESPEGGPK